MEIKAAVCRATHVPVGIESIEGMSESCRATGAREGAGGRAGAQAPTRHSPVQTNAVRFMSAAV